MNVYVVRQIQYTEVPTRTKLLPMRQSLFYDCCTYFVTFHTTLFLRQVLLFCHFGLIARTFKCLNGSVLLPPYQWKYIYPVKLLTEVDKQGDTLSMFIL